MVVVSMQEEKKIVNHNFTFKDFEVKFLAEIISLLYSLEN